MEPPENDSAEEPFTATGRTLNPDGTVDETSGSAAAKTRSRVMSARTAPPAAASEAELELAERRPRAETDYVAPPPPPPIRVSSGGGRGNLVLLLLVLGGLGAGGYFYYAAHSRPPPTRAPVAVVILITSEPTGAAVSVEGTAVGVTPWAADNTWDKGEVHVSLTAPGYRPWSGTFLGARPARLEVKLQRR